ncbi:hypothetical protein DCS_06383 [Drechmeria coniospora]|uniref:Uncharacterized protein n=1 Tax=Drechmeria coniospora TaxID=98403 RepID=A0A151GBK4_DRECN|nr:hypothetical protein DCS_06383 [Drechmeria coniospora]KYK54425.1 hypothetical protein DCS_06383 [Drechmeria coniospora]
MASRPDPAFGVCCTGAVRAASPPYLHLGDGKVKVAAEARKPAARREHSERSGTALRQREYRSRVSTWRLDLSFAAGSSAPERWQGRIMRPPCNTCNVPYRSTNGPQQLLA